MSHWRFLLPIFIDDTINHMAAPLLEEYSATGINYSQPLSA